jgi:protein OS-9
LESYISLQRALKRIEPHNRQSSDTGSNGDLAIHTVGEAGSPDREPTEEYEILRKHGQPYFCTIPIVWPSQDNQTEEQVSEAEQQKELARAANRGRELLQGMDGNQCLFYSTGWWTYSFCYKSQVRQFHALAPGAGGGRVWPPQEDPTTPSYILGRFDPQKSKDAASAKDSSMTELAELQTRAETSYLVQRLEGGTACDLTGQDRKIEVQFHCNPQLTDRIGWIKETATCSYLMVVYTPRLCNDVAFLPPKETRAHPITCQEILSDDEIPAWEARKKEASRTMIEKGSSQSVMIGDIEVGAMEYVGKDGKKIERGRIVLTQEEKAETIVMQKDGQVSSISKSDLKKLDLDPQDIEAFRKELEKLADGKDWKIERLDDVNGQVQLRGIVSTDDDETTANEETEEAKQKGSEEEYKEEI